MYCLIDFVPLPLDYPDIIRAATMTTVETSRANVADAYAKLSERSGRPFVDGVISLVGLASEDGERIVLVKWKDAGRLRGYVVRLDEFNRMKTLVPGAPGRAGMYRDLEQDLSRARVIVSNTGEILGRDPPSMRPTVASWVLVVRRCEQIKLFQGPSPSMPQTRYHPPYEETCVFCTNFKNAAKDEYDIYKTNVQDAELYTCVECISPWHKMCVRTYTKSSGDSENMFNPELGPFKCPICC